MDLQTEINDCVARERLKEATDRWILLGAKVRKLAESLTPVPLNPPSRLDILMNQR